MEITDLVPVLAPLAGAAVTSTVAYLVAARKALHAESKRHVIIGVSPDCPSWSYPGLVDVASLRRARRVCHAHPVVVHNLPRSKASKVDWYIVPTGSLCPNAIAPSNTELIRAVLEDTTVCE